MRTKEREAHRRGDDSSRVCLKATDEWHRADRALDRLWDRLQQQQGDFFQPLLDEVEQYVKTPSMCDSTGEEMRFAEKALNRAIRKADKQWRGLLRLIGVIRVATRKVDKTGLAFNRAVDSCSVCIAEEEARANRPISVSAVLIPTVQTPLPCNFCGREHIPVSKETLRCLEVFWRLHNAKNQDPTQAEVRKELGVE